LPGARTPKAGDEHAGSHYAGDDADLAARYEDLRAGALGGRVRAGHGLALLESRGMAAWMAAWQSLPAPGAPAAPAPAGPAPDGVVAVLACMAAACLARR
jgi:hypothetical protein